MAMPGTSPEPEPRWGDAAALILLSGGGLAAWWADLGSGLLWTVPVIVVAALTAAGALGRRPAIVIALAWIPGSILAAGLPLGVLAPAAWDTTATSLHEGVQALPSVADATPIAQDWALATVLLLSGTAIGAAGLFWRRPGRTRGLLGFVLLLAPLVAALGSQGVSDSAWEGAIVLVAAMLRTARGRFVPIAGAAALVGAVALFGAQVAAPRAGWEPFGHHKVLRQFRELNPAQTYGPLDDRRTGAVMLDVHAPRPALWRTQVLESFDNRRWLIARETSHLPEPAARREKIRVEVRGLRSKTVVSPGRPLAVHTRGGALVAPGYGFALVDTPEEGHTYTVESDVVHASAARLARIRVPIGRRYEALTQIGLGRPPKFIPYPLARLAIDPPPSLENTDWIHLFRLSLHLSEGTTSELTIVRHVEDYLGSGRYRYTTDVPHPDGIPLLQFLFHTHEGYCQHFAGAAALLLRVAGVPSRVVVGFATGEAIGHHTWAVRDKDAHAWIEVYFPGVGWVDFNPTPAAAPADVAPGLDILQPRAASLAGGTGTPTQLAFAAAALVLLAAFVHFLRRRRTPGTDLGDLLARLSPQPTRPSTTLRSLHLTLTEIGPATADLALAAEHSRFATIDPPDEQHPHLKVLRALAVDLGLRRALTLMLWARMQANRS